MTHPAIPSRLSRPTRQRGFTLIELLVATTVLSLMLLFLFSVFDQTTKAWQAGERKIDAFREARAALFMIRRDLLGAMIDDQSPMVFDRLGETIGFSGALAPAEVGSNLFFLTRLPPAVQGANNASNLCTVGYYIAWMRSAAGADQAANFSFNLIRYFIPSGQPGNNNGTIANLLAFLNAGANPANAGNLFPRVGSSVAPENEVLARNITRFELTPIIENGATLQRATPGTLTERPRLVEITLEVINNATAAKLGDTQAAWSGNNPVAQRLIAANKQTFRARLALNP